MDITRFINSRDIREHLKKIGYQFTSLEAAWLIWQCKNITLAEKHEAWRELIRTMPDMKIEKRRRTREWASLHAYLKMYMAFEERMIEVFLSKEDNAVYTCAVLEEPDSESDDYGKDLFSTFEKCQAFVNDIYEETSDYVPVNITKITMFKRYIDNTIGEIQAAYNDKWELVSIWQNGIIVNDICAGNDDFDGMWFSFPTPFKRGDIVIEPDPHFVDYCSGPFVLTRIPPNEDDYIKSHQADGDMTDMIASGYFQEYGGNIYYECMHKYMDLEYYRDELTGKKRILKALSSFITNRIDVELYSKSYLTIMMEEYAKRFFPVCFGDEWLKNAGLK